MPASRRQFLTYLGLGTYAALRDPLGSLPQAAARPRQAAMKPDFFDPIRPSTADELVLPAGYHYDVICAWEDALGSKVREDRVVARKGDKEYGVKKGDDERFGFNCDFLAYFPITVRDHGRPNSREGLLWVNHEYPDPLFISGYTDHQYTDKVPRDPAAILQEMLAVGGSVLYVKRDAEGRWACQPHQHTRRLTAVYPEMQVTGLAGDEVLKAGGGKCWGTLANCSGGRTPWHTVLSCEENYPDYNQDDPSKLPGYRWGDLQRIPEEQFGWIVEVDPFDELKPTKHTALGRFKHENAALRFDGPGKRLVIYMGDDEQDQFLYKFVSADPYRAEASRAERSALLSKGTLYAADFAKGLWLALDWEKHKDKLGKDEVEVIRNGKREKIKLRSQADVLVYAQAAAKLLGATPLDRPEDCEVHPADGSLYVALTNNLRHGNFFGQIVRLIEEDDDPEGTAFRFEIFLAGGTPSGLACPDNLAFDRQGNLWVACDVSSRVVRKGPYRPYGNNGLFVVPTRGPGAGDAYQFASGPVNAELTGPWFTEDAQTLFLSVQHPGEESQSRDRPLSRWPRRHGDNDLPRPAVVAITGFRW